MAGSDILEEKCRSLYSDMRKINPYRKLNKDFEGLIEYACKGISGREESVELFDAFRHYLLLDGIGRYFRLMKADKKKRRYFGAGGIEYMKEDIESMMTAIRKAIDEWSEYALYHPENTSGILRTRLYRIRGLDRPGMKRTPSPADARSKKIPVE